MNDEQKNERMDENDRLDLIRWLIDRHDTLRTAVATRAGIVLTADGILLTLLTFHFNR